MIHPNPRFITFNIFQQFNEILCVFSTRIGGFSQGIFKSQNMGNKKFDNEDNIDRNRRHFCHHFGIQLQSLAIPDQIHSANIKGVSTAGSIAQTDALFTKTKRIFLAVQTADCFPVFIYDPVNRICAIIHAGWRGVVQNIIPKTLKNISLDFQTQMSNIHVAIGPGLQTECFEVREDVFNLFSNKYLYRHDHSDKCNLNLGHVIFDQILKSGIPEKQIEFNKLCTKCREDLFYSYRRDGQLSGRMMGIIGIKD